MPKLPDMGKMIGPLPLGAWLVVIAGGLGVAVYTRRQNANDVPTDPDLMPEDTSGVPGVGVGGSGLWEQIQNPGGSPSDVGPTTNEQWGVMAIEWLVGNNYPPVNADHAVRKYLAAEGLSISEVGMISAVIRGIGSPPVLLPPPTVGLPGPPKPPTPKPPAPKPVPSGKWIFHRIRPGDTIDRVAKLYGVNPWGLYTDNDILGKRPDGSKGWMTSPLSAKVGYTYLVRNPKKLLG